MTGPEREEISPLEMAQNAARAVLRYADQQAAEPVRAYIDRAGTQGVHSAELAGNMALVSIAESLAFLVDWLLEHVSTEDQAADVDEASS